MKWKRAGKDITVPLIDYLENLFYKISRGRLFEI